MVVCVPNSDKDFLKGALSTQCFLNFYLFQTRRLFFPILTNEQPSYSWLCEKCISDPFSFYHLLCKKIFFISISILLARNIFYHLLISEMNLASSILKSEVKSISVQKIRSLEISVFVVILWQRHINFNRVIWSAGNNDNLPYKSEYNFYDTFSNSVKYWPMKACQTGIQKNFKSYSIFIFFLKHLKKV